MIIDSITISLGLFALVAIAGVIAMTACQNRNCCIFRCNRAK